MESRVEARTKTFTRRKIYTNVLNYIEIIPHALSNQENSFKFMNQLYNYLQNSQESEFNQFCVHFPYMDFFNFWESL